MTPSRSEPGSVARGARDAPAGTQWPPNRPGRPAKGRPQLRQTSTNAVTSWPPEAGGHPRPPRPADARSIESDLATRGHYPWTPTRLDRHRLRPDHDPPPDARSRRSGPPPRDLRRTPSHRPDHPADPYRARGRSRPSRCMAAGTGMVVVSGTLGRLGHGHATEPGPTNPPAGRGDAVPQPRRRRRPVLAVAQRACRAPGAVHSGASRGGVVSRRPRHRRPAQPTATAGSTAPGGVRPGGGRALRIHRHPERSRGTGPRPRKGPGDPPGTRSP